MEDAPEDIKKFYKNMFDHDFARVVDLARAWDRKRESEGKQMEEIL